VTQTTNLMRIGVKRLARVRRTACTAKVTKLSQYVYHNIFYT